MSSKIKPPSKITRPKPNSKTAASPKEASKADDAKAAAGDSSGSGKADANNGSAVPAKKAESVRGASRSSTPSGQNYRRLNSVGRKPSTLSLVSGADDDGGFASRVSSYLSESSDKLPKGRSVRPKPGVPLSDSTNSPHPKPPAAEKKEPPKKSAAAPKKAEKPEANPPPKEEKAEEPKPRKMSQKSKAAVASRLFASGTAASQQRATARAGRSDSGDGDVGGSMATLSSSLGASGAHVSAAIYSQAKKSGQINLSGRGLAAFPPAIFTYLQPPKSSSVIDMGARSDDEEDKWWVHEPLRRLILASNEIPAIPDEIGDLHSLQVLDLMDNQLEELPSSIGKLVRLEKLYVSRNQLRELPESLGELIDLRLIAAAGNRLDSLPDGIGSLYYLEDLDVSGNCLVSLPEELTGWRVRRLNVSGNALLSLPKAIGWLQSLEVLDLSRNQISALPTQLGELQRLQTLQLSGNALLTIPPLQSCIALKELLISNNQIQFLPSELFEHLPSLKVLDASHNKIEVFPESILDVGGLERLNLSHNDLQSVPPELALLPTLKSLLLHDNPIRNVRHDILKRSTPAVLAYLRSRISDPDKLALLQADERTLADQIGSPRPSDAIASRNLDLSGRNLEKFPDDFATRLGGKDIHSINLSGNCIPLYPQRLGEFSACLQSLDLSRNRMADIPDAIGELAWLRSLKLCGNLLSALPAALARCTKLYELHLGTNRLAEFPPVIYALKDLEVLVLCGNKISGWDSALLGGLDVLHTLDLSNNEIASVPPQLGNMNLRSLQLEGNPFRIPRNEILAKGSAEVLRYLRSRIVPE